jgi:hypothetical protein
LKIVTVLVGMFLLLWVIAGGAGDVAFGRAERTSGFREEGRVAVAVDRTGVWGYSAAADGVRGPGDRPPGGGYLGASRLRRRGVPSGKPVPSGTDADTVLRKLSESESSKRLIPLVKYKRWRGASPSASKPLRQPPALWDGGPKLFGLGVGIVLEFEIAESESGSGERRRRRTSIASVCGRMCTFHACRNNHPDGRAAAVLI